ncbi:MAG TPA: bifunctional methylenetetrahydrofolate dehydrogenase/methenyltetrahydrofolate cyclohydrolase FolD [Polyangiaceae bacterium]|nr:bifunctional methylenetetrahydrofolate dehydrogenase/methenyltetrahydrofolate cyclohydrolase FolD [Polyangiaceae bacterium]
MSVVTTVLDGKAIALEVRQQVTRRADEFRSRFGRAPGLHVVLAGDDPASAVYVRNKEKAAEECGFAGTVHRLSAAVTQAELEKLIGELNADDRVDGILVQLPLPKGIDESRILKLVSVAKDVDGFHASNVGALWSNQPGLVPCTPRGCIRLLEAGGVRIAGARALVIGRSNIVGKPIAALLLQRDATVTIAHSRTQDLPALCREADIVVAAVGRAKLVKGDWVKLGAAVLDVGTNRDENGKACGDVDFAEASLRAGVITKVPGGVGPMTIAMLMENTLLAAQARMAQPLP